ncbi:helix-turn-helix transcriptional regulator [Rhizobium leguminosarum]|uniref:MarR family transcriptional regulator n=1 Tax=Rhizobium leguminosarum TaxID=384 RepID=A0A444HK98_RHILE|nr:metalloregulator ArsR/SmtB family transcription factor [Rhizobium leguminosarum]MDH6659253.1 putative ArsR family transcriptional regulator [Rhizobium sophorae]MBB4327698.1 putative ArsR family transcriptional regulator [Rhizobium leguminosarum]MBB4341026.1 putative ArsR family transcriptional regulator [Rhizobium leguminosarum]MBB4353083.1 putative ArsR family transcriptional regulator [Rhizobium leguminosarum]MBB4467188.1 putative ArsR family transcriptional regulator [Rhizobium leguminos
MRQSPANRILILIKTDGPQLAAAIGDALGISGEAARQQLSKMAEEGLVEPVTVAAAGRGRPRQLWHLTASGNRQFPDGHAELTANLLGTLVEQLGAAALDTVISAREAETLQRYRQELGEAHDLASRIEGLAGIRTREGYMADHWQEADGSFMLVENHCPICAAATVCAGFCRSELETFRAVLGADIERSEHILAGARRCAYRIMPR